MATMVRREKPPVSKEQRDVWLGHDEKRTANAYEAFDPDYLADCMRATESVIAKLQKHTARTLVACKSRFSGGHGREEITRNALRFLGSDGGRDRD